MARTLTLKPNTIYEGDAAVLLKNLEPSSIDLVLTDPPYFLDKLDSNWDPNEVKKSTKSQAIKHLPAGMKFDPEQGKRLEHWYYEISRSIFNALKPGAFFMSFSSPRLVHRMAVAVEDAGFYIRDIFIWLYPQGWAKASSLERYAPKDRRGELKSWKTPQVRGNYEPIIVAQKPPAGPLTKNFLDWRVGLFNFEAKLTGGLSPSNVLTVDEIEGVPNIFLVPKPRKEEKGAFNTHPTVKPVELLRHLIRLATDKNAIVLDPFLGSGSTAVAAVLEGRRYIGFEINNDYFEIARKRIKQAMQSTYLDSEGGDHNDTKIKPPLFAALEDK